MTNEVCISVSNFRFLRLVNCKDDFDASNIDECYYEARDRCNEKCNNNNKHATVQCSNGKHSFRHYHNYPCCAQLIALIGTFDWWVELLTTREESKYVTIAVGWQFAATDGLIKMLDRCAKSLDLLALVGS